MVGVRFFVCRVRLVLSLMLGLVGRILLPPFLFLETRLLHGLGSSFLCFVSSPLCVVSLCLGSWFRCLLCCGGVGGLLACGSGFDPCSHSCPDFSGEIHSVCCLLWCHFSHLHCRPQSRGLGFGGGERGSWFFVGFRWAGRRLSCRGAGEEAFSRLRGSGAFPDTGAEAFVTVRGILVCRV